MDKRDKLIAAQALELHDKTEQLTEIGKYATKIITAIVGIGGPLNDNKKLYTSSQQRDFQYILDWAEAISSASECPLPANEEA